MLHSMNFSLLLTSLLPGLAPLLVFVAADALFGETVGLAVGIAVGVAEFAYVLIRQKKVLSLKAVTARTDCARILSRRSISHSSTIRPSFK